MKSIRHNNSMVYATMCSLGSDHHGMTILGDDSELVHFFPTSKFRVFTEVQCFFYIAYGKSVLML
jgi:hypothetical protein